jgi:predicted permease
MDARVVAFVVLLTMIASLAAAVLPALLASRQSLIGDLSVGRSDSIPHRSPLRATLLIVQTALSMMLLVGAGLFVRSLGKVNQIEMGFDTSRLVVASTYFPDEQRHPERGTVFPELAARLRTLPGIAGAAYGAGAPLYSWYVSVPLFVPDRDSAITTPQTRGEYIGVSSEYFAVAGTRIRAGRAFLASDVRGSTRVMVIGETMAGTFWPGESPLGHCVSPHAKTTPCYTVVGIAQDVHGFRRLEDTGVQFYLPITQMPNERTLPNALMVRAGTMTARSVAKMLRAEMASAFPGASISSRDAASALAPELRPWRLGAQLFAALGLLALVVAASGVYSVVAFAARRRTHEMGVRMALGARTPALVRMIVAQSTGVVGIGIALGAVGALAAGRFASALLHGVSPRDPLSMGAAAATLLAVGVMASLGPALRSSRVDPMVVLRHE